MQGSEKVKRVLGTSAVLILLAALIIFVGCASNELEHDPKADFEAFVAEMSPGYNETLRLDDEVTAAEIIPQKSEEKNAPKSDRRIESPSHKGVSKRSYKKADKPRAKLVTEYVKQYSPHGRR